MLRAQPEVVHAHGLRNSPGGAPTVAMGRSGVLRAQPEVVNAYRRSPALILQPLIPTTYVRNKFGFEVLKHVEHPIITGVTSWKNVPSGRFIKCPHPGSINYLNLYEPDGNIYIIYI